MALRAHTPAGAAGGEKRGGLADSVQVRNAADLAQLSPCLVNIVGSGGDVLGVALYNRHSTIAARVLSEAAFVPIDAAFFAERLRRCLAYRERWFSEPFYRLAHAEASNARWSEIGQSGGSEMVCMHELGSPPMPQHWNWLLRPQSAQSCVASHSGASSHTTLPS